MHLCCPSTLSATCIYLMVQLHLHLHSFWLKNKKNTIKIREVLDWHIYPNITICTKVMRFFSLYQLKPRWQYRIFIEGIILSWLESDTFIRPCSDQNMIIIIYPWRGNPSHLLPWKKDTKQKLKYITTKFQLLLKLKETAEQSKRWTFDHN